MGYNVYNLISSMKMNLSYCSMILMTTNCCWMTLMMTNCCWKISKVQSNYFWTRMNLVKSSSDPMKMKMMMILKEQNSCCGSKMMIGKGQNNYCYG